MASSRWVRELVLCKRGAVWICDSSTQAANRQGNASMRGEGEN
jgi:chorismate-pyruvate lyase